MKKHIFTLLIIFSSLLSSLRANPIDSLELLLKEQAQLQEKIYIHTDNNCYFGGDTLWYKAYVLRADNLQPSPFSKILYVELLTPDGYLVQRQRVIIDHNTQSFGQFYLPDTIYSGYYELRAYTRWQLNFNITSKPHTWLDDEWFFNRQLANDYFRHYEGLYSRVIPIYEKPSQPGDYGTKRIINRPRRRQAKVDDDISVSFYPEGGQIIAGLPNRVAFEVKDFFGKPIDIEGTLSDGTKVNTLLDGRGIISLNPTSISTVKVTFPYQGKEYSFSLPDIQEQGVIISHNVEQEKIYISAKDQQVGAVSVSCRGRIVAFDRKANSFSTKDFPTGVNEIVVYDEEGQPVANRQIFVNHHNLGQKLQTTLTRTDSGQEEETISAAAYQQLQLHTSGGNEHLKTLSISVRDQRSDDPATYDDGNILTDLLLAGDLKGFVAHPAYYFESDDVQHRQHLDLLLMVQGWRKYAPIQHPRYRPERNFRLEGQVYKLASTDMKEFDLLDYTSSDSGDYTNPCFTISSSGIISLLADNSSLPEAQGLIEEESSSESEEDGYGLPTEAQDDGNNEVANTLIQNELTSHNKNKLKHPVVVEAEITVDKEVVGAPTLADANGNFLFNLPPFYDQGIMFMTAYWEKDSTKMNLSSLTDKFKLNPFACPDFYVRRNMFFPIFSDPYSWHQTHIPNQTEDMEGNGLSAIDSLLSDRVLDNVTVKTRRVRKLHHFDKSKPAMVLDFNTVLNNAADYGLHYTGYNGIRFWEEAARTLFGGNMGNSNRAMGIRASVDGHTFLKTYQIQSGEGVGVPMTPALLKKKLDPRHIWQIRVFTDYDLRNNTGREENRGVPDVLFELVPVPNDGSRAMRRDRRLVIDGFAYPDEFYHPDYSNAVPAEPTDYRRTLYWNANAHPDADGNFTATFYNGSRPTRMKISVCGVGMDGEIYY